MKILMNIAIVFFLQLSVVEVYASLKQSTITIKGFDLPETILHDRQQDLYLVSNISGKIPDKDDSGFISKVHPDGTIIDLKWIDGASDKVTLHSPKGMAVYGRYLYVSDIDTVRVFDRETGKSIKNIVIEGAAFLNDIVVDENGILYVSESAIVFNDGSFEATNLDAIYKITLEGEVLKWVSGTNLHQPNGLEILPGNKLGVVTRGSNMLYHCCPVNLIKRRPVSTR